MAQLNDAVRHVLTLKYLAGHVHATRTRGATRGDAKEELTPANQAVALKTAEESLVLLNNNNHALPLSPSVGEGRRGRAAGR